MRVAIFALIVLLHGGSLCAAEVSTNFWDKFSVRAKVLHGYTVEINTCGQKARANDLGFNNHASIAMSDVLKALLNLKEQKQTTLSEIRKATTAQAMLSKIAEGSNGTSMHVLAFSELTKEEKQDLIETTGKLNRMVLTLTADLREYILNMAELGL